MDTLLLTLCADDAFERQHSIGSIPGDDNLAPCWVAREIYGAEDSRWLLFRSWLLGSAPAWLRRAYLRHGQAFAGWIADKPLAKAGLRRLMDHAIKA